MSVLSKKTIVIALLFVLYAIWICFCNFRLEIWPNEHKVLCYELRKQLNDNCDLGNIYFNNKDLIYYNSKNLGDPHKVLFCSEKSLPLFGQWYVITFGTERTIIVNQRKCVQYFLKNFEMSINEDATKSSIIIR